MRTRRGLSALLATVAAAVLCLCAAVAPAWAHAVVDQSRTGSVEVTMTYGGRPVAGGSLTLYRVGDVAVDDGNFYFELSDAFAGSGVSLADLEAVGLAGELAEWAEDRGIAGDTFAVGVDGTMSATGLELGLYLVVQHDAAEGYLPASPFLVSVPSYDAEADAYVYDVDASPKVGTLELEPEKPVDDTPGPGTDPGKVPETGTPNWIVPIMAAAGIGVLLVGCSLWLSKRGRDREA